MKYSILLIVLLSFLYSCTENMHSKASVESAMKEYDRLIKNMDADSIALLYTPDGDLGNIAHGRDSIKKFLSTFKNVKVLSQSSISDSVRIYGDSAYQTGTYKQVVIVPPDTLTVKGLYFANWQWIKHEGWRIKHMETKAEK